MRKILLGIWLFATIIFAFFVGEIIMTLKSVGSLPYGSIMLFDNQWHILTKKWKSGGFMIPYTGSLEREIIKSIVEIEDNRFWKHRGIDTYGKIASLWENIVAGWIVRGWSTITEQYIKNTYYPGAQRTVLQKLREWISAIILESYTSKEDILRWYLDTIYFWNNTYWLVWAEQLYGGWRELSEDDILDIITRVNCFPRRLRKTKSSWPFWTSTWLRTCSIYNWVCLIASAPMGTRRVLLPLPITRKKPASK